MTTGQDTDKPVLDRLFLCPVVHASGHGPENLQVRQVARDNKLARRVINDISNEEKLYAGEFLGQGLIDDLVRQ